MEQFLEGHGNVIEDSSYSDSQSSLPAGGSSPHLRVLIADHRVLADALATILNRSGFFAVPAYSGRRAAQLASVMLPDVAMIELLIPGPGVLQTCERIRKYAPACRLIVTTGIPRFTLSEFSEQDRLRLGELELIRKPFHPGDAIALLGGPLPSGGLSNL